MRISLLSAGLWWGGFALLTFKRLKPRMPANPLPCGETYWTIGFTQLMQTFHELMRLPYTLRYLIGYVFYNDAIQTVLNLAAVFVDQELFVGKGLPSNPTFTLELYLMIQFVAFGGALLFGRLAGLLGTKNAILLTLAIWSGVVIYAHAFLSTTAEAWIMGGAIALVLGGSQALSRSLFSRMIPAGREAAFFGVYEISERGTSWIGHLVFAVVVAMTNSYRQAILSLIVLFLAGMEILSLTDTERAVREAGKRLPEESRASPPLPA